MIETDTTTVKRLKKYNEWRRGADIEQPSPKEVGRDIDAAIAMIKCMTRAINNTLENNLHLADGDNCTLIELKKAAAFVQRYSSDRIICSCGDEYPFDSKNGMDILMGDGCENCQMMNGAQT